MNITPLKSRRDVPWLTPGVSPGLTRLRAGSPGGTSRAIATSRAICAWIACLLLTFCSGGASAAIDNRAYGILAFSNDQPGLANSIVTFDLEADTEPTFTCAVPFYDTSTAGAHDGRHYYVAVSEVQGAKEVAKDLVRVDLSTGQTTKVGALRGFDNLISDMTYDHSTATMYAISRIGAGNSGLWTISLADGTATKVADLDRWLFTLAASYGGQLYGVSSTGDFCKIDKRTGAVTVVAHTGHYPERFQTMEFDHGTRRLWWVALTRTWNASGTIEVPVTFVGTIDPETGEVTPNHEFGDNQLAGLYIPSHAAADNCPAPVTALTATPGAGGATEVTLTWTNPAVTFGGEILKSITKVEIARDGEIVATLTDAQPGTTSSYLDRIGGDRGDWHTWTLRAYSSNGPGAAADVRAFVGRDVPAAVAEVTVTKLSPNSATVSWTPVILGANGGWTDKASMVYDVERMPGGTPVATGLTATEWFEPGVEVSGTYSYQVTARNSCGTATPTSSATVTLGPKLGVPYRCEFEEDFGQWTPVDANADGNTWEGNYNMTWAKVTGAYAMSAAHDLDDWLVSNPIEFEPNTSYKLNFSHLTSGIGHRLEWYLLRHEDRTAPVQKIGETDLPKVYAPTDGEVPFATGDDAGDLNLAVRVVTPQGNSYVILDWLTVEKVADVNLAATAVSGVTKPIEAHSYTYSVTILNKGGIPARDYRVELRDKEANVLASTTVADELAPGAETTVPLDLEIVIGCTLAEIYGAVVCEGDEVEADDVCAPLAVTVLPIGSPEEVHLGVKQGTSYYHPMNFYYRHGATLNIYAASEIGVKRGRLTGVSFTGNSSYTEVGEIEVKVYLANTDRTKATDGWLDGDEMTLVCTDTIAVGKGDNIHELTFDKAFDYSGANLAMVVATSILDSGLSYFYYYQPYYTSPLAGNNAVRYGGNTPFDFTGNPSPCTGNSVVTMFMQSGGASVRGSVTSGGQPLAGATVVIPEIHAETLTGGDGSFKFDFVPNGQCTVSVSKFGYAAAEPVPLEITDDYDSAPIAFEIAKLPVHSLRGQFVAKDGAAIKNAEVTLDGYTTLTAVTADDGKFEFADVVEFPENTLTIRKDWYVDWISGFDLTADRDFGMINPDYAHVAPVNVTAAISGEGEVKVEWDKPGDCATIAYDCGVADSQIGISTNTTGTVALGTLFRTPMTLESISWMTTEEGGPHHSLNVYVYDLDQEGNPTRDLLYSERSVRCADSEWCTLEFPQPVEAPRGCCVMLNYPGYLGLALDGAPKTHPLRKDTYVFTTDYTNPEFSSLESAALTGNLMLRAHGRPYTAEGMKTPLTDSPEPSLYNVYIGRGYAPEEYERLNESPVDGTFLTHRPGEADRFVASYAVAAVYPDGSESAKVPAPFLPWKMTTDLTLHVNTNSHSGDARGAKVILAGADPADSREGTVDAEGNFNVADLWGGAYDLTITLPGYEPEESSYRAEAMTDAAEYTLREIIATPVNAVLSGNATEGYHLTWNESGDLREDFEAHEPFTVASPGEIGWSYIDADGDRTFAESVFDFPGRTKPCSFMVFNPWLTTPSMADERSASLPHSGRQELACFAGYTGSDDWLISPRLTYHEDYNFSFWARGYSQTYGEVISVGYSTTTADPGEFEWIDGRIDVPMQKWTKYAYTIPAEARYVALRSISPDGFILFVDDIEIGSGRGLAPNTVVTGPEVEYHLLLDGEPLAKTADCAHHIGTLPDGDHTLSLKAVYASGESEALEFKLGQGEVTDLVADPVQVSPNPAPGYTVVRGDFTAATLYDLAGHALRAFGNDTPRLDLAGIPAGLYLLEVTDPAGRPATVKLIVK